MAGYWGLTNRGESVLPQRRRWRFPRTCGGTAWITPTPALRRRLEQRLPGRGELRGGLRRRRGPAPTCSSCVARARSASRRRRPPSPRRIATTCWSSRSRLGGEIFVPAHIGDHDPRGLRDQRPSPASRRSRTRAQLLVHAYYVSAQSSVAPGYPRCAARRWPPVRRSDEEEICRASRTCSSSSAWTPTAMRDADLYVEPRRRARRAPPVSVRRLAAGPRRRSATPRHVDSRHVPLRGQRYTAPGDDRTAACSSRSTIQLRNAPIMIPRDPACLEPLRASRPRDNAGPCWPSRCCCSLVLTRARHDRPWSRPRCELRMAGNAQHQAARVRGRGVRHRAGDALAGPHRPSITLRDAER